VESRTGLDLAQLAALAAERSARFAELRGPASKGELLEALRDALALPPYMGSNWDALEEVLAYPDGDRAGPTLLAWSEPRRMPTHEATTFKAIVKAAAAARASAGEGALVVVVAGP
jgi:hypothetical protein